MATKRMFSNIVIDSDAFLDLPESAQLLYFHIGMKTDDDGFVTGTRRIMKLIGGTEADITALVDSGFLIPFPDSKVYVVTHFRINNDLKNDRYHSTVYQTEYEQLTMTDNKEYRLKQLSPIMDTDCIHSVSISDTECIHDESGMDTEQNVTQRNPKNKEKDNVTYRSQAERSKAERSGDNDEQAKLTMISMTRVYGLDTRLVEQAMNEHGVSLVHDAVIAWKHDKDYGKAKPIDFPSYLKKAIENGGNQ